MANQVGGTVSLTVGGTRLRVKSYPNYNLGADKNEAVVGADGTHGYKSMPQVPYIECEITDSRGLDVASLLNGRDTTVVLNLGSGKAVVWREAWFAGEGQIGAEEGNISARWEAISAEEVPAT